MEEKHPEITFHVTEVSRCILNYNGVKSLTNLWNGINSSLKIFIKL